MEKRANCKVAWNLTSLPNNKFLDLSKLKALADDKILVKVTDKMIFFSGKVENILGKEENAGYQHFLIFS